MKLPDDFSVELARAAREHVLWMWRLLGVEDAEMLDRMIEPGKRWDDPAARLAAVQERRVALGLTASQCRSMGVTKAVYVLPGGAYGFMCAPVSAGTAMIQPAADPAVRVVVARTTGSGGWGFDTDASVEELASAVRVDVPPETGDPVN